MDVVMPDVDGITATRRISELGGGASVIVLTSFAEDDQIFPAIEAGAVSYLLKDVSPDDLVAAVRAAHRDEPRLHPDVARKLMAAHAVGGAAAAGGAGAAARRVRRRRRRRRRPGPAPRQVRPRRPTTSPSASSR